MKTLEMITELCTVLDRHCVGVQESRQALALTDEFLGLVEKIGGKDNTANAAETLELAKKRMAKICKR